MRFFIVALSISSLFISIQFSCTVPPSRDSAHLQTALGRSLFFDTRLSYNQTKSCASCHDPKFAFTDGYRRSITASGDIVKHNAPSLVNAGALNYFDWDNPGVTDLFHQINRPLFNQTPVELGAKGNEEAILSRLFSDNDYIMAFTKAFPEDKQPISFKNIQRSLKAFVSSIKSMNSAYDAFINGDSSALSLSARKGKDLFFSNQFNCASCHQPPFFTSATETKNIDSIYFNTGLYNINSQSHYPENDRGLAEKTGKQSDNGKFKIPSLRNVALTAPYTHDGSVNTLEEMIDIYARAGRRIDKGPEKGEGSLNQNKSSLITGFTLSGAEKKQLIDFLFSLTDSSILTAPAFQNPFMQARN